MFNKDEIVGIKRVRYEFGTLEDNVRAYPLYIKEQKTKKFIDKIVKKQSENKNFNYFIIYRVEVIIFEDEGETYVVPFKRKVLSPKSKLVQSVASILSEGQETEEYIKTFYNK